jgi:DNA repair protein RadA
MHMISRLKEANIEDIRGITSDTIKELKKLNINSVYQLAVQNPSELAAEYEDTSLTVESASRLVANARKSLKENGALTSEFSTADQFLDKRNKLTRYLLVQRTSMTF